MSQFSFNDFLMWVLSGTGLSTIVPFVTQAIKKYLGLSGNAALALTALVSAVVVIAAYFLLKYDASIYVDEYWPLFLLWLAVVFGGSQVWYKGMPKSASGQDGE